MDIVSMVANLVKEKDYYKNLAEEAKVVIKQLSEGPGEVEYIHPIDFGDLIDGNIFMDIARQGEVYEILKTGKKYKQCILVPRKK